MDSLGDFRYIRNSKSKIRDFSPFSLCLLCLFVANANMHVADRKSWRLPLHPKFEIENPKFFIPILLA